VINDQYNRKKDEAKIIKYFNSVAGDDFRIKFEYVDRILPEKNGKTVLIERRI
jgi:hypothetical protein